MRKITLVPLLLLGSCGPLSGCGQSQPEAPADVVTSYLKAFGGGDGDAACNRLTPETRQAIATPVAEKLGGRGCPDAVRSLRDRLPASQADAFKEAAVTRVTDRGETAEVRFRAGRARGVAKLRKVDDRWKISLLPANH